jgi:hypothetical protein
LRSIGYSHARIMNTDWRMLKLRRPVEKKRIPSGN